MQRIFLKEAEKYAKQNYRRRIWRKFVRIMACVVVFCTTYALILPAITMENNPCDLEEHTHDESCYEKVESEEAAILTCSYESLGVHVHTSDCYDVENQLICGQADYLTHVHNADCMDENGTIVCQIPEVSAHEHTDACYRVGEPELGETETLAAVDTHIHGSNCYELLLTCELSEEPAHHHTDECYEIASVLICGLEEGVTPATTEEIQETAEPELELICIEPAAWVHIHGEECFVLATTEEDPLTCTLPKDETHTHGAICYGTWNLICGKEEHTHDLVCQNDPEAAVETEADWMATFADVTLTGKWDEDLLAIARSQLGYRESTRNYEVMEDGETIKGYTRYGDWYGMPYGDWCAMFVSFCLNYADVEGIPYHCGVRPWIEELTEMELYHTAEVYEPKVGDIVFYDWEGDDLSDHVGIVADIIPATEEESAKIKAIEGNSDNCVQYVYYDLDDSRLLGCCDVAEAYEQYKLQLLIERIYSDEFVTVKVTYSPDAGIPDEAELVVKKILPEEEAELYDASYQEAQELLDEQTSDITVTEIKDFQLYDISFHLEGEEIVPQTAVSVEISFPAVETAGEVEVSVVHYAEEGPELPEVQEAAVDESGTVNATFETGGFSLFAVVTRETDDVSGTVMVYYSINNSNLSALASDYPYAIVSGNYALNVDDTSLIVEEVQQLEDGGISANKTVARWIFTRNGNSGSNYYISTKIGDADYYLYVSGTTLVLSADQKTSFTASLSGTNLTLRSGTYLNYRYINLSGSGVSLPTSGSVLSLYNMPRVLFDGTMGNPKYMGYETTARRKYLGAGQILEVANTDGYVKIPENITPPTDLPLRVVGWYDIVNQVYYDESMLGEEIKVTCNTVFYPDYVAATYDIGQPTNLVTNQPDTSDFITTQLFDYNELFNVHSAKYTGALTANNLENTNNWTLDGGLGFVFSDWITTRTSYSSQDNNGSGNIGRVFELGQTNMDHTDGNRGSTTNFAGTITSGIMNTERMAALFTPDDSFMGRHYIGTGDWLYSYDSNTGFYYYNSAMNAATYNQSASRFYVHDYKQKVLSYNGNSMNDFLPFTEGSGDLNYEQVNYWFGMKSEINFYLPSDSGNADNKAANGEDLQFRFSGDDDVWVFVDGQLILDLGGVHDIVYGEINFATGQYKVAHKGATNTANSHPIGMPGVSGTSNVTTRSLPSIEGGKDHTLTVYYLERGATLSNCAIYFNIAPLYELEIIKHDEDGENLLEGATFEVFDDEACTIRSKLFIQDEKGDKIPQDSFTTNENGSIVCTGMQPGKTYYIKETVAPENFPDMSNYIIQLNLSSAGEATVILLNSNNDKWTFADAHRYSDTGHRVVLDVYNAEFIGGEKEVYVEKAWADGAENHLGEEILVHLYANGEPTGHSLRLSADNNWNGTFLNLPEKDSDNNLYEYTVREENTGGYIVSYEETVGGEGSTSTEQGWYEVSSLESGGTYMLVTSSGVLTSGGNSVQTFKWSNLDLNTPPSTAYTWTVTANGTGFQFQNGNGRYLRAYLSGNSTNFYTDKSNSSSSNYPSVFYWSDGKLYAASGSTKYYFTSLNNSNKGAASTTESAGATFTLYKWDTITTSTPGHVPGWRITNTPITEEDYLNLNVQKRWDAVPEGKQKEITMSLYTGVPAGDGIVGQLSWVKDVALNAGNDWRNTFDQLAPLTNGNYYLVEKTQKFVVDYGDGATTVELTIDDQVYRAVQVTWADGSKTVDLTITNTMPPIDIPIEKHWDSSVPLDDRNDVSVTLYAVNKATSKTTELQTIMITAESGWKGVFKGVPIPADGVFYYVEENTQEYSVRYSKESAVPINNTSKTVGLVEFDENEAPVLMIITNSVFYELPETGGAGITSYTMAGLVLILLSIVYLMYRSKARRREEY